MGPPLEPLTFRDVTEAYRREKRSNDITEIRPDFYRAVRAFLDRLWKDNQKEMRQDPFSLKVLSISDTMKKVRSKTTQIFEMRAEKILLMALRASSGARVDISRLTSEEKALYSDSLDLLDRERRMMLPTGDRAAPPAPLAETEDIVVGEDPDELPSEAPVEAAPEQEETPPALGDVPIETVEQESAPPQEAQPLEGEDQLEDQMLVRVLEDIPPFAGPERDYVLAREDVVTLPSVIARALVSRGKALEIGHRRIAR